MVRCATKVYFYILFRLWREQLLKFTTLQCDWSSSWFSTRWCSWNWVTPKPRTHSIKAQLKVLVKSIVWLNHRSYVGSFHFQKLVNLLFEANWNQWNQRLGLKRDLQRFRMCKRWPTKWRLRRCARFGLFHPSVLMGKWWEKWHILMLFIVGWNLWRFVYHRNNKKNKCLKNYCDRFW